MKRGLTALGAVAAVLALGACSDDDEPNLEDVTLPDVSLNVTIPDVSIDVTLPDISLPDSLPDITLPDITLPDISVPEDVENVIRDTFPDLSDAQVDCLVEGVSGDNVQISDIMDLAGECDISLQDLVPGG